MVAYCILNLIDICLTFREFLHIFLVYKYSDFSIFSIYYFLFRNWDQFETNETLFGVKSTFDEDLYTTKLEKGPQMRELEREALRIAREIEGEETHDLHSAEVRLG